MIKCSASRELKTKKKEKERKEKKKEVELLLARRVKEEINQFQREPHQNHTSFGPLSEEPRDPIPEYALARTTARYSHDNSRDGDGGVPFE